MNIETFSSYKSIYKIGRTSNIKYWVIGIFLFFIIIMFIPWTQNIQSRGMVTALKQEDRPQELHSPIPGKIVKWYVKNGDTVKKGDTLLRISEIKDDYLDPALITRTQQQVEAKKAMQESYSSKLQTGNIQIEALKNAQDLKLKELDLKYRQLQTKLQADKASLRAAKTEYDLTKDQYARQQKMYENGLVSLTQLQQRSQSLQNAEAKKITAENKILQTEQELLSIGVEKSSAIQEYAEKISKIQGEQFTSQSSIAGSEGDIAKLENTVATYKVRQGLYYILASQDGQVTQLAKTGIGEVLKEGETIGIIVPKTGPRAVQINIKPVDLPLIHKGQKVMFTFDGYPAIVFSGWPQNTFGTFQGKVFTVENNINSSGYFTAIVVEDPSFKPWPTTLRIGTGANGIALLKDVPIWYELWRNINGFPPDYYVSKADDKNSKEKK